MPQGQKIRINHGGKIVTNSIKIFKMIHIKKKKKGKRLFQSLKWDFRHMLRLEL